MINIYTIKKAALGSLIVIPTTIAIGILIHLGITNEVCWWPFYNKSPILLIVGFYIVISLIGYIFITYWLRLILRVGNWAVSGLKK